MLFGLPLLAMVALAAAINALSPALQLMLLVAGLTPAGWVAMRLARWKMRQLQRRRPWAADGPLV